MKGVYFIVFMLLVFAIPTIDQISLNDTDASFERFYVYSFVKLTWRVGDESNFRFELYTGNEYGMPESYDPAIDLIAPFIFRYKSQGILVSKGTTKWTYPTANFGLHDHEFAKISELLRKMHPST